MFRDIGIEELLVILLIALLVFGAAKLPQIGQDLGKAIHSFRKALSGEEDKSREQIAASKIEATTKVVDNGKGNN
jgi:sec-independent protein translocase protein TatA